MNNKKQGAVRRLARLEGQVRGVIRIVDEDRCCVDILNRTSAIRLAIAQVEAPISQTHTDDCVEDTNGVNDAAAQREKFIELVGIFAKLCR